MQYQIPLRDGQQLSVRVYGQGQLVILLHGFGSESRHWLPNILPLMHQFQFILPDLRGFGASHLVPFSEANAFHNYVHDLHDIIQHFQLERFYLGGISTGAYVCLIYNREYGFQQVERYLNIEHSYCSVHQQYPHGLFRERQSEIFTQLSALLQTFEHIELPWNYWQLPHNARLLLRDTMAELFQRSTFNPLMKRVFSSARYAEKLFAGKLFPIDNLSAYLHVAQSFMQTENTYEALADISAPIYFMAGEQSEFFSLDAHQAMMHKAPLANLTVFKRSGHIPIIDRPVQFQKEFTRFLTEPTSHFNHQQVHFV